VNLSGSGFTKVTSFDVPVTGRYLPIANVPIATDAAGGTLAVSECRLSTGGTATSIANTLVQVGYPLTPTNAGALGRGDVSLLTTASLQAGQQLEIDCSGPNGGEQAQAGAAIIGIPMSPA
jgi:hypothetical protein